MRFGHRFFLPALLLFWINFYSFAFLEWKYVTRAPLRNLDAESKRFLVGRIKSSSSDQQHQTSNCRNNNHRIEKEIESKASMSKSKAMMTLNSLHSSNEIDLWLRKISEKSKVSNDLPFQNWNTRDQVEFVKILQERKAYEGIISFLYLGKQNVKVFTTAAFAMSLSKSHRRKANDILDIMLNRGIKPTSLTVIAILGGVDGPSAVFEVMKRMESSGVQMNDEAYNSAIFAVGRTPTGSRPDDKDWQMGLSLLQKMKAQRIKPTSKTYFALLQVLGRTGKVSIAMSLIQQWKSQNTDLTQNSDQVWASAINVCAQAADHHGAIKLVKDMQEMGCVPKLRHCSALLKAFSRAGEDKLALVSLQMMLGEKTEDKNGAIFSLPKVEPDLIALNTVIKACSKANNIDGVTSIFDRIKAGEFVDPKSNKIICPDHITYHCVLGVCSSPKVAKNIVKEMRFSRRYRYGVVPPTSVTYAYAINICQRADDLDLQDVECFLGWAEDDGIKPTVFMYASAIWSAQRIGDCSKALEFFHEMESLGCEPNSVAFDGVISALCGNDDLEQALEMYEKTRTLGHSVSLATMKRIATLIQSLQSLDEEELYMDKIAKTLDINSRTVESAGPILEALINFYGSQGRFDEALETFDSISGRIDGPCLRAILYACAQASPARWTDAVTILHTSDIVEGTSGPGKVDQVALGNAIIACCKADEFEEGLNLLQLYGAPQRDRPKTSPSLPMVSMNSLIAACGRGFRPDLSLALLNEMRYEYGLNPDSRSYRSAVIACNRAEHLGERIRSGRSRVDDSILEWFDSSVKWWECGLALLRRMQEESIRPDMQTYSSIISACESAGEWQRALGVLEVMIKESEKEGNLAYLNLYCFNAAISACEKGGAWVEALEIYERMVANGDPINPNFVTLSSLILALDKAGQKELAQGKYEEGLKVGIVRPWRRTRSPDGNSIRALDLHNFSAAMGKAAIRSCMDAFLQKKGFFLEDSGNDLVIITGKGLNTADGELPVLQSTTLELLEKEYGIFGHVEDVNQGRVIVKRDILKEFVQKRS